jgi:hypothetical protein
MVIKE